MMHDIVIFVLFALMCLVARVGLLDLSLACTSLALVAR